MPGLFGIRVSRCRHGRWVAAITFYAADLPEDVVALVDAHLLDLGGTYDVPEAGRPDPVRRDTHAGAQYAQAGTGACRNGIGVRPFPPRSPLPAPQLLRWLARSTHRRRQGTVLAVVR